MDNTDLTSIPIKESNNEIEVNYETVKKYGDIVSVLLLFCGYLLGLLSRNGFNDESFAGKLREKAKKRMLEKAVRSGDLSYGESLEKIKAKENEFSNINSFLRKAPIYFSLLNIILLIGVFYIDDKSINFQLEAFGMIVIVLLFSSFYLFFGALGLSYNPSKIRVWYYLLSSGFILLVSLFFFFIAIVSI